MQRTKLPIYLLRGHSKDVRIAQESIVFSLEVVLEGHWNSAMQLSPVRRYQTPQQDTRGLGFEIRDDHGWARRISELILARRKVKEASK